MKIIDLLNKIANGEEVPNKIKIGTHIFTKYNYSKGDGTFVSNYESNNDGEYHINDFLYPQYLNDGVEILEEENKIPERLNQDNFQCVSNLEVAGQSANYFEYGIEEEIRDIVDKINEIIDYLKSKGE